MMRPDLVESQGALRESLYDLYELGGLEAVEMGIRGVKRELIVDLEMSGLIPTPADADSRQGISQLAGS